VISWTAVRQSCFGSRSQQKCVDVYVKGSRPQGEDVSMTKELKQEGNDEMN
jgi:hypothetical protein